MENSYKKLNLEILIEGEIGYVPINLLNPSQPDDGRETASKNKPLEIARDKDNIIIIHGNYRYYRNLKFDSDMLILAKVIKNPYQF